jgi:hypothetical protein
MRTRKRLTPRGSMAVASGGLGWRESVRWDPVIYRSSKFSVKLRVCAPYALSTQILQRILRLITAYARIALECVLRVSTFAPLLG